ncbi:MAG: DUF3500 domain-containing protein [Gemmataceae bacterium]|nr:DUF3500 domain-containing protein [Gemmataceae bacterium]
MKHIILLGVSVLLIGAAVFVSRANRPSAPDDDARAAVIKLFQSLSDEQKALALRDVKDKDRYTEAFPAVKRPGIAFSTLKVEQRTMINDVIKAMCSEYGAQRCLEIAKEGGERYLTFFGEPTAKGPFAWRVGMHHLTLVYADFGQDKANEFGPILLGGNPAKTMWEAEEKIALALYAALTPEEVKSLAEKTKGASSGSGASLGKAGVRIGDLNEKARKLAGSLLQKRLDVFSADRRKIMEGLIERDGGVDNLRVAVWGAITKSHLEGGNYHWRIGSDTIVCDWQTAGKNHIHMTLRGRAKVGG